MNQNNIQVSELSNLLTAFLNSNTNLAFAVSGATGIGKTTLINKIAKKNNKTIKTLHLGQMEDYEISGLPRVDNNKLNFYFIENLEKSDIIFFDEFNRASDTIRKTIIQLLLEKQTSTGLKLKKNAKIILALNEGSEYETELLEDMDKALQDRILLIKLEPDKKSAAKYLQNKFFKKESNTEKERIITIFEDLLKKHSPRRLEELIIISQEKNNLSKMINEVREVQVALKKINKPDKPDINL
jgi:MoxR-like ATPase